MSIDDHIIRVTDRPFDFASRARDLS